MLANICLQANNRCTWVYTSLTHVVTQPTSWTQTPMCVAVYMSTHNQLHRSEQTFTELNIHSMQVADT